MRVLALDTTTAGGSAALVEGGRVLSQAAGDPARSQAEQLPALLLDLLAAAGLGLADIDRLAVGSGPGSFTGLRIGIATIQGLGVVSRRPVAAVSALEALGHVAGGTVEPGGLVGAWMDARRHEVFTALYRVAEGPPFSDARLVMVDEPSVGDPAATIARWVATTGLPAVLAGDGAAEALTAWPGRVRLEPAPPLAGVVGQIAAARPAGTLVDPAGVQPVYVRRPDVEMTRDRSVPLR